MTLCLQAKLSFFSALFVSQKKQDTTHVDNFVKYWSIFKILSLLD